MIAQNMINNMFETPHPNVSVRRRRNAAPPSVQRRRGASDGWRVIVTEDLEWLRQLQSQMAMVFDMIEQQQQPYALTAPKPELVPTLCAEIVGGDCCVCMEPTERADVRRFGCGHDTCAGCFKRIYDTTAKCPMCRAEIKQVSRAPVKRIIQIKK